MWPPYLFMFFSQYIIECPGVEYFAAGKRLRQVNVGDFEGCNILFQLFYNVLHRLKITKTES